jgi:hypothetical protein
MSPHVFLVVALGMSNAVERAENAALQFSHGSHAQDRAALRSWRGCGPAAVPVLRRLVLEESLLPRHEELLETLVAADGRAAVPVLQEVLREDWVYWHNLGLNIDTTSAVPAARVRRLEAVLRHLAALGGRDDGTVAELHAFFTEHPIFGAHEDSVSIVRAANWVLRGAKN